MSEIGDIKRESRLALHDAMAAQAFYRRGANPEIEITARWHNRMARAGNLDGGDYAEIITGINRLVFNETNLAAAADGAGVVLKADGYVRIPELNATFKLETEDERDGPENVYWLVSVVR